MSQSFDCRGADTCVQTTASAAVVNGHSTRPFDTSTPLSRCRCVDSVASSSTNAANDGRRQCYNGRGDRNCTVPTSAPAVRPSSSISGSTSRLESSSFTDRTLTADADADGGRTEAAVTSRGGVRQDQGLRSRDQPTASRTGRQPQLSDNALLAAEADRIQRLEDAVTELKRSVAERDQLIGKLRRSNNNLQRLMTSHTMSCRGQASPLIDPYTF